MTPQAVQFIEKANELLMQADRMLQVKLYDACGRNAYLAAFHVAQALIFERESKIHKTHNGVRTEFGRLTKDDARLDGDLRGFLARSYNLKAVADYETGPGSHVSYESLRGRLRKGGFSSARSLRWSPAIRRIIPAKWGEPWPKCSRDVVQSSGLLTTPC